MREDKELGGRERDHAHCILLVHVLDEGSEAEGSLHSDHEHHLVLVKVIDLVEETSLSR